MMSGAPDPERAERGQGPPDARGTPGDTDEKIEK